mgnify:FL=1
MLRLLVHISVVVLVMMLSVLLIENVALLFLVNVLASMFTTMSYNSGKGE